MTITEITSVSQLNGIISKSKDRVSVIDFHATWCGPCHAIAPTFKSLADKYSSSINFLKCDVDAAKDVASLYRVSAMPTFVFLRGSEKIDQIRGANKSGLEDAVRRYATISGPSAFSGKGQTLGGAPAPVDVKHTLKTTRDAATDKVAKLDPQVKVFFGLLAAYLAFWYLSR